uniref:(northern house mosquito) hypothetical protein n=1 Tax=Culex pipiens TaxID=7175 RepID=A0A8D8NT11_CULPI
MKWTPKISRNCHQTCANKTSWIDTSVDRRPEGEVYTRPSPPPNPTKLAAVETSRTWRKLRKCITHRRASQPVPARTRPTRPAESRAVLNQRPRPGPVAEGRLAPSDDAAEMNPRRRWAFRNGSASCDRARDDRRRPQRHEWQRRQRQPGQLRQRPLRPSPPKEVRST